MKFLLTKIQQVLGIEALKREVFELQTANNFKTREIQDLTKRLDIQSERTIRRHEGVSHAIQALRIDVEGQVAREGRRITNLSARVLRLRNNVQRAALIEETKIELTGSGQLEGLSDRIGEILNRNMPIVRPGRNGVGLEVVAPLLPSNHPKSLEQKARDERFLSARNPDLHISIAGCEQKHVTVTGGEEVTPKAPHLHEVADARHFTCTDFFNERLPWFAEKYVTPGSLTARVNRMAVEEGVQPIPVKTKARTLARSWPIMLLKRAARDVALDKGAIVPATEAGY